jgi:hypothetical protein
MPTSAGTANREYRFRIVRLRGTSNFSLVGYIDATNKTEAIAKPIKEYNVPEKLRDRLDADSDEVARAFRDDVARCSDMMPPGVRCLSG